MKDKHTLYKQAISVALALCLSSSTMFANNFEKLKGTVINKGTVLNTSLLVQNTSNGAISKIDKNGHFEINAKKGDILCISHDDEIVNYYNIENEEALSISINQGDIKEEILNIAFGTSTERAFTGAVDVIRYKDFDNRDVTNSHHLTQGQLAGLTSKTTDGSPGYNSLKMYVRGKSTYGDNAPLVLVDGFEADFAQISRDEIESITVLKDAVSTAMYGMRGANGVIQVTTKAAQAGKVGFKVNAESGLMSPTFNPEFVDAAQYATLANEASVRDGYGTRYSEDQISAYKAGNDPYNNPNINWAEEMMKDQLTYVNTSVQATGGSEAAKFYVMANYMYTEGMFKHADSQEDYSRNNDFARFNFRAKGDLQVSRNTELSFNFGGRVEDQNKTAYGIDSYINNLYSTPNNRYVMYNEDGSYGGTDRYRDNPMAIMQSGSMHEGHNRSLSFITHLEHELDYVVKGLSIGADLSFDSYYRSVEKYSESYAVYQKAAIVDDVQTYTQYGTENPFAYDDRGSTQNNSQVGRLFAKFNRTYGDHDLFVQALYQDEKLVSENEAEPFRYRGLSSRFSYGFKEKYFVDATASYNGSNAYKPGDQFGFFPALGLSWIASEESFLKKSANIDYLKIRASMGKTGNDLMGGYRRFMYLEKYETGSKYYYGDLNGYDGIKEADIENPDVKWEDAYQLNVGFDLSAFKHWTLGVDVFYENRDDILQSIDKVTSDIGGIEAPVYNYGEVKNRGIDLNLAYTNKISQNWDVSVNGNLGFARSEISEYYETDKATFSAMGESVGSTVGFIADGFYNSQAEIDESALNTFDQVQVGDVKYKDISGANGTPDGKIDEYDKTFIGYDEVPEIHYGIALDVRYRNLSLYALFDGVANRTLMMNSNLIYRPLENGQNNISEFAAQNSWTPELGNNALLPRMTVEDSYNNYKASTLYKVNGNYLYLRTLELAYHLPANLVNRWNIGATKIFLRGNNVFSIDNVDNTDVEITSGYPQLKSFNLGLNLQF